jgi:hypothetical protein
MKRIISLLVAALLPGTAQAVQLGFATGHGVVVNDPFVVRQGPTMRLLFLPKPWLVASLNSGFTPLISDSDKTRLADHLIYEHQLAPDLSRIHMRHDLTVALMPKAGRLGGWQAHVGPYAGLGVVHTYDDLELLQVAGVPEFEATREEFHATTIYGLGAELRRDVFGLGVRLERQNYTEVVGTTTLETKQTGWVMMEASWRFGGSSD